MSNFQTVGRFWLLSRLWRIVKIGESFFVRDDLNSDTGPFSTPDDAEAWVEAIQP